MGALEEMEEKLRASRARLQEQLIDVKEEQMTLPVAGRVPRTVRAMFYLLISHEAEHTVQLVKTLAALGINQSEAQLILHSLRRSRGELEGLLLGLTDDDLDRVPAEGEWSPRKVLEHIIADEVLFGDRIKEAVQQGAAS
ncbi:MAG: DinB family protein [Dehalococcoidia bacterium]|nr:DinB family protein [Dehalococcoidia bacterium]